MEVLVTARSEYQKQMCNIMTPYMIEIFQEMFDEAGRQTKGKNTLKHFQSLLKDVKNWNSNLIRQHNERICNTCSWYNDLLAAIFVSAVKILSAVRLTAERKKINIKVPSNETFIQGCFENAARDLYKDPYIFVDDVSEYEKDDALANRFSDAIVLTINNMIPVQDILKANIGERSEGEIDFQTGLPEEEDEDEDDDEEETPEAPMDAPDAGAEAGADAPREFPGTPGETPVAPAPEEVREIHTDRPDDDVLFPDAPETK